MEGKLTDLSPNKRPKLSTETLVDPNPNPKGKTKIAEEREPEDRDDAGGTCGICLAEGGARSIRGEIESCGHYFCFVCIMEWSKVESKCPLCKRRFSSIRRPPVEGLFASERIVIVPERNQVYHPLGNVTEGPEDIYANVDCSYCQNSANENLLLLCDLCDSAAHTYCVGLGYDVPDGDWFCSDCMVTKNEHSKSDSGDDRRDMPSCDNLSKPCASSPPLSIFEIIADEHAYVSRRHCLDDPESREIRMEPVSNRLDTLIDLQDASSSSDIAASGTLTNRSNKRASHPKNTIAAQAARTLRRCRDVRGRIQKLRDNWNELRSGSVTFGSTCTESEREISRKGTDPSISRQKSTIKTSRVSQPTQDTEISQVLACSSSSRDIDRAWRMMDAARTVQPAPKLVSSRCQNRKPVLKGSLLNDKEQHTHSVSETRPARVQTLDAIVSRNDTGHISHRLEKFGLKPSTDHVKRQCNNVKKLLMHEDHQAADFIENNTVKQELEIARSEGHHHIQEKQAVANGSCTCTIPGPVSSTSAISPLPDSSRVGREELLQHENYPTTSEVKTSASKDDENPKLYGCDAKSEIQSIVKLNLKLQRIDKSLGSEGFKKAARVATHTILAACGLQHSESIARKLPEMICKHSEQIKSIQRSKLMHDSCRECFFSYARDVVAAVSSELIAQASHRSLPA